MKVIDAVARAIVLEYERTDKDVIGTGHLSIHLIQLLGNGV